MLSMHRAWGNFSKTDTTIHKTKIKAIMNSSGYKLLSLFISLLILSACAKPPEYDLVISQVGFFDGEDDLGIVNIGIRMDTIAAISKESLAADSIIDGTGKYIIPGLVNAHVHITSEENLKEGYQYGILANLNMHTGLEDRERQFRQLGRQPGYPFYFGVGQAATVPGGHPTQYSPDMETISDTISIRQFVDNRIAGGADFIKIIREGNPWMGYPAMPTLSYEQIGELIGVAHERGYPALVHIGSFEEMYRIAPYRPDGFVHMWTMEGEFPMTADRLSVIAESGAFVVPTAYMAEKGWKEIDRMPESQAAWIRENLLTREQNEAAILSLYEAGIMLVAGTDPPNARLNFGDDLLNELALYHRAGLSTTEVLRTATGNAAKAFGLPVGLLKVGSKANMLLLDGDPLKDLAALRQIQRIWKSS